jgi:hypothetical protein
MSEVFELVVKYRSLTNLIFGIIILFGGVYIYFNNPITFKTISNVISSKCNQNLSNKWNCDLNVIYTNPFSFESKKTNVTLKNQDDKIDINDNIIIDIIENISFTNIIFSLITGIILISVSQFLYNNRKNKNIQKYIGAASIINII